jgi:hypothetical protein
MMPVPSLPLSRILTSKADHGIRGRVPYETPMPARRAAEPDIWSRASERSVADFPERTLISTTAPIEACRSALLCALLTADPREQLP